MMGQYRRIKQELHQAGQDAILLFRLGDFYETFYDDAKLVADVLDVTLTARPVSKKDDPSQRVPMAGIPYHALDGYLSRLVNQGFRVAICEQMEDPKEKERIRNEKKERGEWAAKDKLVKREVIRIVTPGTLTEPTLLDAAHNNYLAAVIVEKGRAGLAFADISTGEFFASEIGGDDLATRLDGELSRLQPAELLVCEKEQLRPAGFEPSRHKLERDLEFMLKSERERQLPHERVARTTERELDTTWAQGQVTTRPDWQWEARTAREALLQHFKVGTLDGFGLERRPLAVRAAGALLQYIQETQRGAVQQMRSLRAYESTSFMFLDPQTRRNLELLEGTGGRKGGSLVSVLDKTQTPMGARLLRRWLAQPLVEREPLLRRQDAVGFFVEDSLLRNELREALKQLGDLERTTNRVIARSSATPRDLVRLRASLRALPAIAQLLREAGFELPREAAPSPPSDDDDTLWDEPTVAELRLPIDAPPFDLCDDILDLLERAITENPPALLDTWSNEAEENIIRRGFSEELETTVGATSDARAFINSLEAREQERTGIKSLKVGYNTVFGYYIEVSRAVAESQIPKEYERKQTLVNAERYITAELKIYQEIVERAQQTINDIERRIFRELCGQIAECGIRLLETAAILAEIDVYAALAEVAVHNRYVRPQLTVDDCVRIREGRHPVVEKTIEGEFIANDTELSTSDKQILVITGPNMSGKSTALRQVALIVLMAQIGSYVPADSAEVGLVDRIFTRIGAQDDIATGQSTFMVEMIETANILHNATQRSLIILDEIGRGTSTYDGLSIARAVVEYLHNHPRVRAKTLFATHYHELTELAEVLPRVHNFNVGVAEEDGHVVFLRKIVPGGADRSYGIHVAQMAGMPLAVVKRAEEVLAELEGRGSKQQRREAMRRANETAVPVSVQQMALFTAEPSPVEETLRKLDVSQLTPLEALTKLYELQRMVGTE